MSPGDVAVLNRDMMEWQTVHDAAQARRLKIIHYGTGAESDVRLVDYIPAEQLVVASIMGRSVQYRIGAAGTHMALNSLASARRGCIARLAAGAGARADADLLGARRAGRTARDRARRPAPYRDRRRL
jgi:UDP-N-acetylmuramyl pentapeptide synthase